jgi:hypothetical protein
VVTVVVVPFSGVERPMPDKMFLDKVEAHLRALRPICTKIKVIAPRYVPLGMHVQVLASAAGTEAEIREAVMGYLKLSDARNIGDGLLRSDVIARIMAIEGVYKVEKLEFRPLSADSYVTDAGDMQVQKNNVIYLARMEVGVKTRLRNER